jgi:hypothetical protein
MSKKSDSVATVQEEQQHTAEGKIIPFVHSETTAEALAIRVTNRMKELRRLNLLVDKLQELQDKADNLKKAFENFNPDNCNVRLYNGSLNLTSTDPAAFTKFCEIQLQAYAEQMGEIEAELTR